MEFFCSNGDTMLNSKIFMDCCYFLRRKRL
jgi:hypothetical protein